MNCKNCAHKKNPDGGYCYMWKDQPENCHYFKTNKNKPSKEYENTAADDYLDYLHDQW